MGALSASITQGLLPLSLQEQQGGDRLQRQLTVAETDLKAPNLRGTPGAPATDTFSNRNAAVSLGRAMDISESQSQKQVLLFWGQEPPLKK